LDFSESENLQMHEQNSFSVFSLMLRNSKTKRERAGDSQLARCHELSAKTKTKTVAILKTVVPGKGWSLKHKIAVEIRELVRRDPQELAREQSKETAKQTREAAGRESESSRNLRRESTFQIRSSHGFQNGYLSPQADIACVDKVCEDKPTKIDRRSLRGSLSLARDSLSNLIDFVKPNKKKDHPTKSDLPNVLQGEEPCPPPYRMSWLDAEPADINCQNETSTLQEILNSSVASDDKAKYSSLLELLSSLDLESFHATFVQQAMEDLALLKGLALDSKTDFRNFLKDDIHMEKFGHREAVLRAVLGN